MPRLSRVRCAGETGFKPNAGRQKPSRVLRYVAWKKRHKKRPGRRGTPNKSHYYLLKYNIFKNFSYGIFADNMIYL